MLLLINACTANEQLKHIENNTTRSAVQQMVEEVKDGDLVLRKGNDITSNMLAQLNIHDKRFSHIGICFIENNQKVVYHSLGAESGSHNYLRKERLDSFYSLQNNLSIGLARLNDKRINKDSLHTILQKWYIQKLPFDMAFDWQTDDKMYCSEMVAKAIMYSASDVTIPITDTLNKQYYAVDNIIQSLKIDSILFYSQNKQ